MAYNQSNDSYGQQRDYGSENYYQNQDGQQHYYDQAQTTQQPAAATEEWNYNDYIKGGKKPVTKPQAS